MKINKKKCETIFFNISFLFRYSWKISKRIFTASVLSTVFNTVEPFVPLLFSGIILDELTAQKRWNVVVQEILALVAIELVLRLLRLGLSVFINMSVNQCDMMNGIDYAGHFLDMDYEKLEDGTVRDLQQKVSRNVRANSFIYEDMGKVMTGLLQLVGYSWLIFSLHPLILLLVALVIVSNYFLSLRSEKNKYSVQPQKASMERKSEYLFHVMTDFSFAKEVRINRASVWLSGKVEEVLGKYSSEVKGYYRKEAAVKLLSAFVDAVQLLLLYGYAAWQAVIGQITVGNFSVYVGAVLNFSGAFASLAEGAAHIRFLSDYVEEYREYIKLAAPSGREKQTVRISGREERYVIEFRNVSFRYPNTERMVLKNVSLTISDGEKLAVVGRNGAGKSTFIKLLCRLYEPTEGKILYNGTDISSICYADYVRLLSVVFQDYCLFAFSVKDNMILNQEYDKQKAAEAIRKSGLQKKVDALPLGIDTSVGREFDENGIEFSGGEGQKLVMARAYYRDAPIVILDEPTAALDAASESEIYMHFKEIMGDRTAIFISHRLASARFCDKVAVFDDGRMVEYGTHESLMKQNGLYEEMFRRQAEYYRG